MKKYILRPAPYSYFVPGYDLYDGFDQVAKGSYNPLIEPVTKDMQEMIRSISGYKPLVLSAPDNRSHQTAQLFSRRVEVLYMLREIEFEMSQVISRESFYALAQNDRVNSARQAFFRSLCNDRLSESFSQVMRRAQLVLTQIMEESTSAVYISHSFFMKCIEALLDNPKCIDSPDLLLKYYSGDVPAYKFLEGFEVKNA